MGMNDVPLKASKAGLITKWVGMVARAAENGELWNLFRQFFGRLTFWLTVLAGVCIALVWGGMQWVGEANVTVAFMLYLPPLLWILPVVPLLCLGLLFNRRCLIGQLVGLVLVLGGWFGYKPGGRNEGGRAGSRELTVMTYNRGQHMNQSLQPFKNAIKPDLIVFQDAAGRADGYLQSPDYAEFSHGMSVGEFTLISRHPIKEGVLIPGSASSKNNVLARFAIVWNDQIVSIYAVHLRTPRDVLRSYSRGAFLWGVIGLPGTPWAGKRLFYQKFWDEQISDCQTVLDAVLADPNPSVIAGDFNAPHTGRIHRMMTDHLGDAHMVAGRGFGFTFPGVSNNPLSLGGPWLRIDYVFYDRHWKAVECVTESGRPSQHRAVAARLALVNK